MQTPAASDVTAHGRRKRAAAASDAALFELSLHRGGYDAGVQSDCNLPPVGDRTEVARELTELLYALMHDVGAPLRVIDGFSEALLEEQQNEQQNASSPDALEYLTTIRRAVSRMNEMFDGILQLHRVSQAPLRRVDIDVTALAETIVSELRATEPARDVRFAV